jgi:hypothetical protein
MAASGCSRSSFAWLLAPRRRNVHPDPAWSPPTLPPRRRRRPGAAQLASRILEQGALVINRGGTVAGTVREGCSHQGIISEAWIAIRMGRCNVM